MTLLDSAEETASLLDRWEKEINGTTNDPVPVLTRIAELIEDETAAWYKMDPDPFDDRHPGRADPNCALGHLLKSVFKNEQFMNKLVSAYLNGNRDSPELIEVSCRLLYDLLPGLETTIVFQENEPLVRKLVSWASGEHGERQPLASYAVGLLGAAMEIQEIAGNFKESNAALVPTLLKKLHDLQRESEAEAKAEADARAVVIDGIVPQEAVATAVVEDLEGPCAKIEKSMDDVTFQQHHIGSETPEVKSNGGEVTEGVNVVNAESDSVVQSTSIDTSTGAVTETVNAVNAESESVVQSTSVDTSTGAVTETVNAVNAESESVVQSNSADTSTEAGMNAPTPAPGKGLKRPKTQTTPKAPSSQTKEEDNLKSSEGVNNISDSSSECGSPPAKIKRCGSEQGRGDDIDIVESPLVKGKFPAMADLSGLGSDPPTPSQSTQSSPSKSTPSKASQSTPAPPTTTSEDSGSSWAEQQAYVIGTYCLRPPLSANIKQRLILQYLAPMGEYQELLQHVFEQNAMGLIFYYLDLNRNKDVRLAFEASKYLASLLCHKKFTTEFIQARGVEKLLDVRRPSLAATGVSMCLYYLAYFEDSMERVCMLPMPKLQELVRVMLWLLECSHESGRCHATMFFSLTFSFRVILDLFDQQDGLRKLYNVISTLDIMNIEDHDSVNQADDKTFTSQQNARHVSVALKRYFEARLFVKASEIMRNQSRNEGSPLPESSPYKALKLTPEMVSDNIELLLECLPMRMKFEPVMHFLKLGGTTLLLQLVAMATEWSSYVGKAETIRSALDVLSICCTNYRGLQALTESIPLPDDVVTPAISILLGLAEGDFLPDPDVQKSALNVLNIAVCAPLYRGNTGAGRMNNGHCTVQKKLLRKSGETILTKIWDIVRDSNGIMVLLKLITTKTPITEADAIRSLACKALVGMSRSDTIRQIISKLPLFNNGQLQTLMREPVLQEKRQEHVKFCKHGVALIERVSGKPPSSNIDISIERIRKADIVAQTKIVYQEKELLQLIQEHLMAKGLPNAAAALQLEAGLPRCSTPPVPHPDNPLAYATPKATSRMSRQFSTPLYTPHFNSSQNPLPSTNASPNFTPQPIRVNIIHPKTPNSSKSAFTPTMGNRGGLTTLKQNILAPYSLNMAALRKNAMTTDGSVSLDKIVTEYLRKQHAACTNPVVTCPPFSLLKPHVCPEAKSKSSAPVNITSRLFRKTIYPPHGGCDGLKADRKFLYSRFRPVRSMRDQEEDGCFSCCAFSADEKNLLLGTYAGELKVINIQSQEETGAHICHNSPVSHCETTRDGRLVVTCSTWGRPLSALWRPNHVFDLLHGFEEDSYMEFSKTTQDKLIGTKDEVAHVYDVETGRQLLKLHDEGKMNTYLWNRATFNPTDELVLNDGVLWDVNSGKSVHKFDKFNPNVSGVFHPNGLEIIINSEVWDIRSFHLLHTVPALDQCQIRFNSTGNVIYGAIHQNDESELEEERIKSPFGSSFRTFDGADYSNIATIDVKRNIFDLATDSSERYIAVVENIRSQETLSEESVCRLYEVGRLRDLDDQEDQEDEVMNGEEGQGSDDEDDDDDDDESISSDEEVGEDGQDEGEGGEGDFAELSPVTSDDDGEGGSEDEDDEDYDDVLFELSDVSSGPWIL